MRRLIAVVLLLLALVAHPALAQTRGPLVLAAASMQEALEAAANAWVRHGHAKPVLSFAASSALARQVAAGAPADLFVSADEDWMDDLAKRGLLVPGTRATLVGNRLVLVAGLGQQGVRGMRGATLARVLAGGALAMGDPGAVPAGKYGREALTRLGVWNAVAPRVVRAESVRAALALVERGAAPYGVVYATDARIAPRVKVVGIFPASSHSPISYPIARLTASRAREAEAFRTYLLGREGQAILHRFGFARR